MVRTKTGELNELPRCMQRGINRKIIIAPGGGELNLYPPLEESFAGGGLNPKHGYWRHWKRIDKCGAGQ